MKNKITEEFNLNNESYNLFVNFLTSDSNDTNFIIYGFINISSEDGIYFIGLVENDKESLSDIKFLVPLSVYDYKTEFIEFKINNKWG